MGVADMVRVSTLTFSCLRRSFTATPEFLFLVDNEQAGGPLNFTRLPDKFVCADEDINLALGEVGEYLACLFGTGARQVVDTHGKIFEALGECVEMLIGSSTVVGTSTAGLVCRRWLPSNAARMATSVLP